mmetsp:Transcript_12122/g.23103  ORF Transcript_12122/g.23103 Transcript_12122/m.23103 type:complete len:204 (-) Transcript_12122:1482-2093(-)
MRFTSRLITRLYVPSTASSVAKAVAGNGPRFPWSCSPESIPSRGAISTSACRARIILSTGRIAWIPAGRGIRGWMRSLSTRSREMSPSRTTETMPWPCRTITATTAIPPPPGRWRATPTPSSAVAATSRTPPTSPPPEAPPTSPGPSSREATGAYSALPRLHRCTRPTTCSNSASTAYPRWPSRSRRAGGSRSTWRSIRGGTC